MHRYFWKQIYRCIPFLFDYKPLYIFASHLELVEGYFSLQSIKQSKEVNKFMKSSAEKEAISVFDENGDLVWISDVAAGRLCLVLTGIMALAISPVFVAMLLM